MKIVDMHCDTISALLERRRNGGKCGLLENDCHVDLKRMKKGGYLLQNFAVFVDQGAVRDPWEEAVAQIELYWEELNACQDLIAPVKCYEDIAVNEALGKMSALLTVEEGAVCGGEIEKLQILHDKGVRMLTLTWNYQNELGYPNLSHELGVEAWGKCHELKNTGLAGDFSKEAQDEADRILKAYLNTPDTLHGLTQTGREFVEEMERLHMIPDVSHLSDAGFYDVLKYTSKPFAASHSNARAVCPCARNLTDDMIRALGERGGVMGLNFCADFLVQKPAGVHNPGTIADIVAHARHIADVGGIEVLGLGSDFDGIDTHEELPGAEKMYHLADALVKGGFLASQVEKIFSQNVLRLYRETL